MTNTRQPTCATLYAINAVATIRKCRQKDFKTNFLGAEVNLFFFCYKDNKKLHDAAEKEEDEEQEQSGSGESANEEETYG